jgi:23S rRNA (uracil1939-C5)-methyltransferase
MPTVDVELTGMTHGGEAVGRLPDGKAVFVPFAIPGERVRVEVVEERRRWARARLVEVLAPSPDRVLPACPAFGACGGCHLQHIAPARQRELKRQIVVDQLERIGKIADPPVAETVAAGETEYRATARFAVDDEGRLGFRRAASHDVVPIAACPLLTPAAQALRSAAGDAWRGTGEVTVRAGDVGASVTADGRLVDHDQAVTFRVAGFDFRVSAGSFFQAGIAGAEALVRLVRAAAGVGPGDVALDLYAGVGLFARVLAADGAHVVAVEASPAACADARVNLPPGVEVRQTTAEGAVARLVAERARLDVVVLDPPRRGAGAALCADLTRLGARAIVYVSCDPAALGRDARALVDAGYRLAEAVPVDQFAHTAAIETVATFAPAGPAGA